MCGQSDVYRGCQTPAQWPMSGDTSIGYIWFLQFLSSSLFFSPRDKQPEKILSAAHFPHLHRLSLTLGSAILLLHCSPPSQDNRAQLPMNTMTVLTLISVSEQVWCVFIPVTLLKTQRLNLWPILSAVLVTSTRGHTLKSSKYLQEPPFKTVIYRL